MDHREIEKKLEEFEDDSETVRLLLNDGSRYEGTVEKDPFRALGR